MKKCLVVLSGGQDSTTCLFWAKQHYNEVHAITFNYGQRHVIEIEAARKVAQMAGVASHEIVDVRNCLVSSSPLTSASPLEQYQNAVQMEEVIGKRVELTFVPMRNMFFFVIAMNRAVALGCTELVTGICQEDNANYPDCTEAFAWAFEDCVDVSLGQARDTCALLTPLMYMSKADSVRLATTLPGCWEALAYSHTSYDGKYPPTDMNHSNVLRAAGFEQAGLPDPLVLRAHREGLMALPTTANYSNTFDKGTK